MQTRITNPSVPIGGKMPGGTIGSVLFIGANTRLAQDNAKFFWDDTNFRLGVGTASPQRDLDVNGGATIRATTQMWGAGNRSAEWGNTSFLGSLTYSGSDAIVGTNTGNLLFRAASGNNIMHLSATNQNVAIGTAAANTNAILDLQGTTKAFLPPRMTTTQKNAVSSPTAGMVVYDSTLNKLCVYTGAAWETVTSI